MSNHTRGEWNDSAGLVTKLDTGSWAVHVTHHEVETRVVARVFGDTRDECEANARIIAAAPELLTIAHKIAFDKYLLSELESFGLDKELLTAIDKATK